jgi:hypothetical protein
LLSGQHNHGANDVISDLLLAADLVDAVANPSLSIGEHEAGAARLAILAAHGARLDVVSLEGAAIADVDLLSNHVWRWAINEAKQASGSERPQLPQQELIQALFSAETDRVSRLLLAESVLTHPEAEARFADFDELREPVPLQRLPNVWPRDALIGLIAEAEGETEGRQPSADLTEMGMILLQIATPAALALLGGTIWTLREMGRETHPLVEFVRAFIAGEDEELAQRLGLRARRDRST